MGGSKEDPGKSKDHLSSFINGKQNQNTTVVFFSNNQKHSTFESDTAHLWNTKVQKLFCIYKDFPLLVP